MYCRENGVGQLRCRATECREKVLIPYKVTSTVVPTGND